MNMLDMYTREKANKIRLDELHQEAKNRRMLREASRDRGLESVAVNRRRFIALAVTTLISLIGIIVIAISLGLHHLI